MKAYSRPFAVPVARSIGDLGKRAADSLILACSLFLAAIACKSASAQQTLAPSSNHINHGGPSQVHHDALRSINEPLLRSHIRFLADDLLEGRGPGTRGDDLTQLYLETQFQGMGLQPGAKDGSFRQSVPLVGVTTKAPDTVELECNGEKLSLTSITDFMSSMGHPVESAAIEDAEIVFVGYGIQAPEYQWNDFKDADLKGKILLVMNNDPADDPNLFEGKRRLYYGRWDYKYHTAALQGAAGAIIIHTTASAGYPWQVIQTSWSGEEFELRNQEGPRLTLKAWATEDACRSLAKLAGRDLDQLRKDAESRDFRPQPLGVTLSMQLSAEVRQKDSANVLGLLRGSDPALADEVLIYMAHHDHLGMAAERDVNNDNIYNGAIDNASGIASLLAIAKAYANGPPPARSVLFATVAAEEQGLLGSQYFASNPPLPPGKMAAVINIDGINFLGRTKDLNVIGLGKSSLDGVVKQIAASQGRIVTADHFPDRGYYYRSDQFSLAKVGVPGVYLHSGINVIDKPEGWAKEQLDAWVEKTYHQPSDEYRDDWDLAGAIEDLHLLYQVGWSVASAPDMPQWTAGDEFEAARQKALSDVNGK